MRFLVVTAYLVACNAIFAGMIFVAFTAGEFAIPAAMENPWFVLVYGTAVLVGFWYFVVWGTALMERLIRRLRSRR